MGNWFDKLMAAGRGPIVVAWSPTDPNHKVHEDRLFTLKQITRDKIVLSVSLRNSFDDEFEVNIGVTNFSNKALGFGAAGVVLIVTSRGRTVTYTSKCLKLGYPNYFDSPELRDSDKPRKVVTVDTIKTEDNLRAIFDAIPEGDSLEVLIQANRIFAAPYLFRFPFEMQLTAFDEVRDTNQISINELARQLEVRAQAIIDYLPEAGVAEKKTHSSSIDFATAETVRKHFRQLAHADPEERVALSPEGRLALTLQIKKSGLDLQHPAEDKATKLTGVGGWLSLLILGLVFGYPFSVFRGDLGTWTSIFSEQGSLIERAFSVLFSIPDIVFAGFSIYIGIRLAISSKASTVKFAKRFLVARIVYGLCMAGIGWALLQLSGGGTTQDQEQLGEILGTASVNLIICGSWYSYLTRSRRVAAIYNERDSSIDSTVAA
jgi:hypothetical protein